MGVHVVWFERDLRVADHPAPIVVHDEAVREATSRIHAVRWSEKRRKEAERVREKHGSRRRSFTRRAPCSREARRS